MREVEALCPCVGITGRDWELPARERVVLWKLGNDIIVLLMVRRREEEAIRSRSVYWIQKQKSGSQWQRTNGGKKIESVAAFREKHESERQICDACK